mmetsp:Transcript_25919/g.52257  ORF Transcript_25919/g.52257 Transcript_25919/m.52257 type:complete len:179 (-) Transcript_25919:220-756(-)
MGQGLNLLHTCESVHADEKQRLGLDEVRYTKDGGLILQDFLAACGDVSVPAEGEPQTKKNKGVHRPLLRRSQRPAQGDVGVTALMVAAQFGSTQSVERLITERANVNAVDSRGCTPLHWAAQEGHAEVCLALLLAGAEVGAANADGQTPLQLAAREDPETAARISRFLRQHDIPGADA